MRTRIWIAAVAVATAVAAEPAGAQTRGAGSGWSAATPPVTKSDETPTEASRLPTRDLPIEPRHGVLGAPGAAFDSAGPSRLGRHGTRSVRPYYGEEAQASGGEPYQAWVSGDRVRSWSSADVRAARQQQAPDLEWATASGHVPSVTPQAAPQERIEPGR